MLELHGGSVVHNGIGNVLHSPITALSSDAIKVDKNEMIVITTVHFGSYC